MKHCLKIFAILFLISMNTSFAMNKNDTLRIWVNTLELRVIWNELLFLLHDLPDYQQFGLTAQKETENDSDLEKMYNQFLNDLTSKGWGEFKWLITVDNKHTIEIFSNGLHVHHIVVPEFTEGALRELIILQYDRHIPYAVGMITIISDPKKQHASASAIASSATSSAAASSSASTASSSSNASSSSTSSSTSSVMPATMCSCIESKSA